MIHDDTLYRQLLWITHKAGIKPGWAWYRYQDITGKKPIDSERGAPVRPMEPLLSEAKPHMNRKAFAKVCKAWADAMITKEQREARKSEASKIKATVWRELDYGRPRLDDL